MKKSLLLFIFIITFAGITAAQQKLTKELSKINYLCVNYEIHCFKFTIIMVINKNGLVEPVVKDITIKHPRAWENYQIKSEVYDVKAIKNKQTGKTEGIEYSWQVRLRGKIDSCRIPLSGNLKDESKWIWGKALPEDTHESWGKQKAIFTFPKNSGFENVDNFYGDNDTITHNHHPKPNDSTQTTIVSRITSINGMGRVKIYNGPWVRPYEGMGLTPGTRIRSFSDCEISIDIGGNSRVILKPNSEFIIPIDEQHNTGEKVSVLEMVKGVLWARAKKDENYLNVNTPNAICGVRGTEFQVSYEGDKTTVEVFESTVWFSDKNKTKTVEIEHGYKSELTGNGLPTEPVKTEN